MSKKFVAGIYAFIGVCLLVSSAFAVNMNNAGWYLHVDLKNLEKGNFASIIQKIKDEKNKDKIDSVLNLAIGKELKEQIKQITIYGAETGYNDFTVIVQGDFNNSAKSSFFERLSQASEYSTKKVSNSVVHQWTFDGYESEEEDSDGNKKVSISLDDGDKPLILFAAEVDSKTLIVSRDEEEVTAWLNDSYNKKDLTGKGVFSVVVHLDRAIAHGGLNFGEDVGNMDFGFDSKLMKKVSQFSFSVREEKEDVLIEVGLAATDEKIAMQLKNVVNGFIALTSMAGEMDENFSIFMSNLNIDVDGVNVLLKSSISTQQLKELLD